MKFLTDISSFASVLLHGLELACQSFAAGGLLFLFFLARPLASRIGADTDRIILRSRRFILYASAGLVIIATAVALLKGAVIMAATQIDIHQLWGAHFISAAFWKVAGGLLMILAALRSRLRFIGLIGIVCLLIGNGLASHAAARLDNQLILLPASLLHQLGAFIWIGGLPCFLAALRMASGGDTVRVIGQRYSILSMIGVGLLLGSGMLFGWFYVGSVEALIGTAYGTMLLAKISIFLSMLLLGAGNYFTVERLRRDPATPFLRLRRYAEVEMGLGVTLFFVAASLTSLPPAVDLTQDRASLQEIVDRLTPRWPSFDTPERSELAVYQIQQSIATDGSGLTAYVPGMGLPMPRNDADKAWSEYNHHGSGIIVLIIGLLALLERTGRTAWARHWPLMFVVLGIFIFFRTEAEGWPFGTLTLAESLRDPEFIQHKFFVGLVFGFALFEWSVRNGQLKKNWARYIFPLICAAGGALLLTHSHSIFNIKELLLIEITHIPLALFAIASGWARWLELRLPAPQNKIYGWLWPLCFCLVGLMLLIYRES